jgi:hypothetical protein
MIPKFIQFSDSPHAKIRECALSCINQFILQRSQALFMNLDAFIQVLSRRAQDESGDVRTLVCQAFVMLLEVRPEILIPQLDSVVQFMLFATQDQDDKVALEACEFWLAFAEMDNAHEHLRPYLPKYVDSGFGQIHGRLILCCFSVIPVLLKGMIYSEYDLVALGGDEDDANVPDREQDIKPRHYKSKSHFQGGAGATENGSGAAGEDVDQDEDDEDDDDEEVYSEWNIRKCSAAALDVISNVLGNEILDVLLPILRENLFHKEWLHREAGILALGAIAEGESRCARVRLAFCLTGPLSLEQVA